VILADSRQAAVFRHQRVTQAVYASVGCAGCEMVDAIRKMVWRQPQATGNASKVI
jgi:hypothetical protein